MPAGSVFTLVRGAGLSDRAGSVVTHVRSVGLSNRAGSLFTHTTGTPLRIPLWPPAALDDYTFELDKLEFNPFVIISSTTDVDLTTSSVTSLYTIPSGITPIVIGAIIEVTAADTITSNASVSIGIAAGETDIFATTPLVGLGAVQDSFTLWATDKFVHGTTSDTVSINVQTAATATSLVATVRLIAFPA